MLCPIMHYYVLLYVFICQFVHLVSYVIYIYILGWMLTNYNHESSGEYVNLVGVHFALAVSSSLRSCHLHFPFSASSDSERSAFCAVQKHSGARSDSLGVAAT